MRPSLPVPSISRRAKIIIGVVVLLVLVLSVLGSLVRLYVDWLWFGEVGFRQVFTTNLGTRALLFALFGALMAAVIAVNLVVAYRFRPPFRPMSLEQQNLERYRSALEPRRRLIVILVSAVLGIFTGITAQAQWQTWLLWRNGTPFGVNDPQFGRDIAYYAFTYPFQRFVLGLLFTAVVLSLVCALAVHYVFGGVRLQTPGEKVTPAARVHLSVLIGLFVLLKAVAYYLDRYGLLFNDRDGRTGAAYTDINAVLPAKTILMFVALICAAAVFANIFLRNVQLPAIALVLLVLTSILASGIYPAIVQQFTVRPNANEKEAEYIGRNIQATRTAYGIKGKSEGGPVNQQAYNATTDVQAALPKLTGDTATIPNARLLDPNVLTPTFRALQQLRNIYDFPDKLDIDRYTVNGVTRDYVVAVRELKSDNLSGNQQNWINRHTFYTHGNGFVAAAANEDLNAEGDFEVRNLPPTGPIKVEQPRIYYGELITDYSIVKTPNGEFDQPGSGGEELRYTYTGTGGIDIGSPLHRLAFATYFRERNILLSGAIQNGSRIMIVRDPADRVEKVAPFLKVDGDPYPAVVGGKVQWIVDGYTTINNYPYSERAPLGEIATDSRTGQGTRALPRQDVNYIRNSVKATVDAYTGEVKIYEFDENDPVLRTWMKAYPNLIRPKAEISQDLQAHLRYPEDLFKVQRDLITRYHVTDPGEFFNTQDFWRVPGDPTQGQGAAAQPPYYIVAQAPGQEKPVFQLTSALNALQRDNLAAYVTVSSDPEDYGQFQVLELPGSQAVLGPGQVQGRFNGTPEIATQISLLDQRGSQIRYGNLLTLPVAGGLLYIEPLYVQGQAQPFPILQYVLVAFGNQIAFDSSLSGALDKLFGEGAGENAPETGGSTTPSTTPSPGTTTSPTPGRPTPSPGATGGGTISPELSAALSRLSTAYSALQAAYRSGDINRISTATAAFNQAAAAVATVRGSG